MSWLACLITLPSAFTNCCLRIGSLRALLTPPERSQPFAKTASPGVFTGCVQLDLRERALIVATALDINVLSQTAHFLKTNFPHLKRFVVVSDRSAVDHLRG
jgi:hypothetical protein